jgi:aconitate hydratase
MFNDKYASVFEGDQAWKDIETSQGETYDWNDDSTYIANLPFFEGMTMELPAAEDIKEASLLALLGDSVTTDHISPAGAIKSDSPAGLLLSSNNIGPGDFNSYGSRRGNHNIMMRGTFANIRIKNEMVPGVEGGFTKFIPTGETMPIFDAAMKYVAQNRALVVVAGKEYGTGSSRDWAAKGTDLLGVKAVIAESFERIHRSNLAGMGVLPLQFNPGDSRISLGLKGDERISVLNLVNLKPRESIEVEIKYPSGEVKKIQTLSRLDTADDVMNYQNGGILPSTLRKLAQH